jgi:hypothetical protein
MNKFFARAIAGMIPFRNLRHKVREQLIPAPRKKEGTTSAQGQMITHLNALGQLIHQDNSHVAARLDVLEQFVRQNTNRISARLNAFEQLINENMVHTTQLVSQIESNQVMLSGSCREKYLMIAGTNKQQLHLHTSDSGELCFTLPQAKNIKLPPVLVLTLPKAGTHFMAKILDNIGYQNAGYYVYNYDGRHILVDYRSSFDIESRLILLSRDNSINMPLDVSLSLLLQGQYATGHIVPDAYYDMGKIRNIRKIHMIRDLRVVLVSLMRWYQKLLASPFAGNTSEELMLSFIDSHGSAYREQHVRGAVIWMQKSEIPTIRYEDLLSVESSRKIACAEIIADVVDGDVSSILSAIEKAANAATITKMDAPSALAGYWTAKVEDAFVAHGFDELNKQLDYAKKWRPAL